MPRPRRFREGASPAQIAQEYAEGRSTRELESKYGLSRWCITAWCVQHGIAMRSRDDALERQRYFSAIEAEQAAALLCVWPKCSLHADDGRLCANHWLEVAEHAGRGCAFPPHCYENVYERTAHLCSYHLRKCRGEISG